MRSSLQTVRFERTAARSHSMMTFKRELLDVKRTLLDLRRLLSAKNDLAIYIGLRPDVPFTLADNVKNRYVLPQLSLSLEDIKRSHC